MSIYDISYMWYAGVACMIVIVVGGLSSIAFSLAETGSWNGDPEKPVHPDLIAPGVETLFCCWPFAVRSWLSKNRVFATTDPRHFDDPKTTDRRRHYDDVELDEIQPMKNDVGV